jgi:adenosylcobinamide-GDP ribazoletransferase
MPDETNDQLGDEESYVGDFDPQTDGNGQVSAQSTADNAAEPVADTPPPSEEEPVGATRPEPKPFRKMSAADFKKRQEPKPAPKPPEPVRQTAVQPEPVPNEPEQKAEPEQRTIPSSVPLQPAAAPEPAREPVREPVREPMQEPVYEAPVYEEPIDSGRRYYEPVEEPEEPRPRRNVSSGGLGGAIKAAFSFFTIIRINVGEKEIQSMNRNLFVIPFVGLVFGLIAAGIGIAFNEIRAVSLAPVAVLGTIYILSKFLHFDGLVDFGDGMIASGDREACIRALKDTRIGAGGFGIALMVILATYAALGGIWGAAVLSGTWGLLALAAVIVIMEVFTKNAMVAAAAFGEPGNGMAAEQVRNTNMATLFMSTIVSTGLAFVGYVILGLITSFVVMNGVWSTEVMISAVLVIAGAAASSIFIGWLIAYLSNRKFGFVNGDVLGATNEIARLMILFVTTIIVMFYTLPELGVVF